MPVYTRCPQCGKAYAAEDSMAGQEVLCRKCGAGFRLPAAGADSNTPAELTSPPGATPQQDLSDTDTAGAVDSGGPKVETFDSGMKERGVGSAKSRLDVNGPVDTYDVGGAAAAQAMRENPPFDFPMAADLDRWAPKIVIFLTLLWVILQAAGWSPLHPGDPETKGTQPSWSWFLLAGWLLIVYLGIWIPIVDASVRRAMGQLALRIPLRRMPRVATIAVLPFAVGAVFWLAGESITSLVTGVILGCLPAGGAGFFLLRLRERQIAQVLMPIMGGIAIAFAVSAGLTWGVNSLLGTTLRTYKTADVFAGSPLGPCLTWPARELAAATPSPRSGPGGTATRPVAGAQPRRVAPPPVVIASPLVERIDPVAVGDDFDAAVFTRQPSDNFDMSVVPPRPRDLVAIQRRSKTEETDELMFVGELPPLATAKFTVEEGLGDAALSSDGRSLARLARFPRLSVHVWSFASGRVARWFDLSPDGGPYHIVGFNSRGEILVQSGRILRGTERVPGLSLEWLDPQAGGRRMAMELNGSYSAVVTYSRDLSHVAVINTARETPVLEVYQVPSAGSVSEPVQMPLDGVDAALAARPSAVALSPDNTRIAVTFEQQGQLVLMLWDATTGTPQAVYVFPGGLDLPASTQANPQRSLVWLADPYVLLYAGNVVFDPNSGRCFGSLSLGDVVQAIPVGGRSMWVETAAGGGRHRLLKVKLSSQVSPATQPTTRTAAAERFR